VRTLRDADDQLTCPGGAPDGRRWRIIIIDDGDAVTVWQADDGTMALEVLRDWPSWTTGVVTLRPDQVEALDRVGLTALAALTASIRHGTGATDTPHDTPG
jgi:hypothetical protein